MPPFSITQDGITASFTSSGPAFFVDAAANEGAPAPFSGNGLFDVNGANAPLNIAFSQVLSKVVFDFGLNAGSSMTVQAFLAGSSVGSGVFTGVNFGPFDVGSASLTLPGFDMIVVTRNAPDFGIDNIQFTTVPEPASLLLLGTGVAGVLARTRRRRT